MTPTDPDGRGTSPPPLEDHLSTAQIEEVLTEAEESLAQLRAEVGRRRLHEDLEARLPAFDLSEARGRWHQFADYIRHITQSPPR